MRTFRRPFTPCRSPDGRFAIAPLALAILMAVGAQQAHAQATEGGGAPQSISIAAQPLSQALTELARQTSTTLVAAPALLAGKTAPAVSGTLSARQALDRLLTGSGLIGFLNGGVITVQRAPETSSEAALPEVKVTARAERAGDLAEVYAGGQVARGGRVGVLGNKDVMDTPFNITHYTAQKVQDQQVWSLRDALIDDPSFRAGSGDYFGNSSETFNFRGFGSGTANVVTFGGLYNLLGTSDSAIDSAERIEVLKGPSAMLNGGVQALGGSVNIVPKRAPDEGIRQFTASYNSHTQVGGHLDIGQRFGEKKEFGVRFNGVVRDGETYVKDLNEHRELAALGLDFRGERLRLSSDLGYQYKRLNGSAPLIRWNAGVSIIEAPQGRVNQAQSWDWSENEKRYGIVKGEYDLSEKITVYGAYGVSEENGGSIVSGQIFVTNINGAAITAPAPRRNRGQHSAWTAETGIRSHFETGAIGHELVLGIMKMSREDKSTTVQVGSTFPTNIYTPATIADPKIPEPALPNNKTTSTGLSSVALADTLSFFEKRVQLTLGVRHQKVEAGNFNGTTGAATSQYEKSATSPSIAILLKPSNDVSLYANYIQGLEQGEIVSNTFSNGGTVFPPYKTKQYETGVKVDWGRFTTTASLFQISRPSIITDNPTNTRLVNGEQRNRGLELNVFGELTRGVRLLGGAMFLDAKLAKTQGGLTDGWTAAGAPKRNFNLSAEWDVPFVPGLTVTGRAVHTSEQYFDTLNPRRMLPSWTRYDLGARYTFNKAPVTGKPAVLRLSVENVRDSNYWLGGSNGYTSVAPGRTVRLSFTTNF